MISAYDQMLSSTHTFLHAETSFVNMADALEEVFTRPSFSSFQGRLDATPDATFVSEHEFLVSKFVASFNYDQSISSP